MNKLCSVLVDLLTSFFLLLSLSLALPTCSYASDGRAYLSGQAGMFLPIESRITVEPAGREGDLTYNPGLVLIAAGGYQFGNGIRGEAEVNFRRVTADKLFGSGASARVDGEIRSYGFMANLYYDFRTRTAVTPFLGAGVGLAIVDFGAAKSEGSTLWNSGQDQTVAYQAIAGFAIALGDRLSFDFAYHHYGTPSLHFASVRSQYKGLNLSTGIRYRF